MVGAVMDNSGDGRRWAARVEKTLLRFFITLHTFKFSAGCTIDGYNYPGGCMRWLW